MKKLSERNDRNAPPRCSTRRARRLWISRDAFSMRAVIAATVLIGLPSFLGAGSTPIDGARALDGDKSVGRKIVGEAAPSAERIAGTKDLPATPEPGATRTRAADGMVEVFIPAGTFLMGSDEAGHKATPVHEVTITQGYWMDRHEVTRGQYRRVIGSVPSIEAVPDSSIVDPALDVPDGGEGGARYVPEDDHPVAIVTWHEARAYCLAVGGRLPTEAEWERAARGGASRAAYPWGDQEPCEAGPCRANFGSIEDGYELIAPVCSFPVTTWGLCDLAGNVFEWVHDWQDEYSASAQRDPQGPATGIWRVLRGGSWFYGPFNLRSSFRDSSHPANRDGDFGFRCVRDAP